VVNTFFSNGSRRCFVQASTTAIELGLAITGTPSASHGCLFYTNSVVFPLTILRERCPHSVYSFCGSIYDPLCGGWLFPASDAKTTGELQRLFNRDEDPLTTAFLSPSCVTAEGDMFFMRDETSHLVATVMSSKVPHVVLMAAGDRVRAKPLGNEATSAVSWLDSIANGKTVSLVFADVRPQYNVQQMAQQFSKKGIDVTAFESGKPNWIRLKPQGQ
jgi:hypothetical protein